MKKYQIFLLVFLVMQISITGFAQENRQIVQSYLEKQKTTLGLDNDDVNNWTITNEVFSKSTGITSVYIQQTYQGIPVHNAVANLAVKNGNVFHFGDRLVRNLKNKISGTTPSISPIAAVAQAANQLGLASTGGELQIIDAKNARNVLVSKGGLSFDDIPVELVFQPTEDAVKLAWDLSIHTTDGEHWWSVRVDAHNGEIISKNDWIVSCTFPEHSSENRKITSVNSMKQAASSVLFDDGSSYNVFAFPVASPSHGPREILTNPAHDAASPYGWHDTNGTDGPEYTITRGNNVWAQDDFNGDDGTGYSPDGGASLIFDFPYTNDDEPIAAYEDASITNLFYVNNVMHDVWYTYGFDEASGNFQAMNYSGEGLDDDYVFADAQDGSGFNNANFGTPPDGYNPRMQMYLWNPAYAVAPFTINNTPLAGSYVIVDNAFEPGHVPLPQFPGVITGDLALAEDSATDITDACTALVNPAEITGKIAVVRRGSCNFTVKVLNAQNAGAIAVIVVNNEDGANVSMSGAEAAINIPAVFIDMATGEAMIAQMASSTVNVTITDPYKQLLAQDGSFDNVIIAHEYGHGISTRLTGGAANSDCLSNLEQMGEGWSDWFGLMLTLQAGEDGTEPRGIGTYAVNQPNDGTGIRPAAYSTNFGINDYTYGDTNDATNIAVPHGMGFVWATMLWDLSWRLIEDHGFDPDLYNGTGGNNLAMQLVIDGLKLQPCSPGFVNGRDAILAADMAATGGENQCAIWEVFANRGLGYGASQGFPFNRTDQVESFEMPPLTVLNCTMSVNHINDQSNLHIYPNPSKGMVNINSTLQNVGEAVFNIYDINGRLVLSQDIDLSNNHQNVDANNLATGVYVVKIVAGENIYTQKLIME